MALELEKIVEKRNDILNSNIPLGEKADKLIELDGDINKLFDDYNIEIPNTVKDEMDADREISEEVKEVTEDIQVDDEDSSVIEDVVKEAATNVGIAYIAKKTAEHIPDEHEFPTFGPKHNL